MQTIDTWAIVLAMLMGPVFAVQAQKWVELARERRNNKLWIFSQLMATRSARVSPEHVRALNMIDLAFYGRRVGKKAYRTRLEHGVLKAWSRYRDHLNAGPGKSAPPEVLRNWIYVADDLFAGLLHAMSIEVGLKFDRVLLRRGAYAPLAHGDLDAMTEYPRTQLVRNSVLAMPSTPVLH